MAQLPGKPAAPMGAEGQINVDPAMEAAEPHGEPPEDGDDRVNVPVGTVDYGPVSPGHGAAGGINVDFEAVAPLRFTPSSTTTGMTESHPAIGGR
jgi:hypothetical protein